MKLLYLFSLTLLSGTLAAQQNVNNIQYSKMLKSPDRKEIRIPDIMGFKTLKCDFHMHTVFSDGVVWPTVRVEEAWEEGLDAIAITDHIENQPSKKYVSGDHNASYEIALEAAKEKNILLVHAGEITRGMPPGHLNALFLEDTNPLDVPVALDALMAAKKQGAFIIWNHPGWKAQQPDTCLWMPMHQELFEKGLINGVEVFNEVEYYPIVLDWCLNRKMAVICNSDIHDITAMAYDLEKGHRPMTLVFAKDRSLASLKEAMFANRTVAYFDNKLAGNGEFLAAIIKASVKIVSVGSEGDGKTKSYEIGNSSTVPFDLITKEGAKIFIPSNASVILQLKPDDFKDLTVTNLFIGTGRNLKVTLK